MLPGTRNEPSGTVQVIYGISHCRREAQILNAADRALKLRLQQPVPEGDIARVELAPGFQEKGTILYCRPQDGGFDVMVELESTLPQQRREARFSTAQPVVVTGIDDGLQAAIPGTMVDFSESGLGLLVDRDIPGGTLVSIATEGYFILGEVRHSSPHQGGTYRIGILVERMTQRSGDGKKQKFMQPRQSPWRPLPVFEWGPRTAFYSGLLAAGIPLGLLALYLMQSVNG